MNVVVLLAPGFEEIETVTIVDVFRRAGITTLLAGISNPPIPGGHGIKVMSDASIDEIGEYDAVVLPGGGLGCLNLEHDQRVLKLIKEAHSSGKYVGAICAAPHVLGEAGIMGGVTATCYPGTEVKGARCVDQHVVQHGKIITSKGPATAMDFALSLVEALTTEQNAKEVRRGLLA